MMQNVQKSWQVQVQGQVYEAELEELKQWITEGAVLPSDNVRRGDLRWLRAEKVPSLCRFFDFAPSDISAASPGFTAEISDPETFSISPNVSIDLGETALFAAVESRFTADRSEADGERDESFCYWHKGAPTAYACDICENFFCKECPKSFGGTVKLCPLCGSLCRKRDESANQQNAVGAIHKPYIKPDDEIAAAENRLQNTNEPPIPGFGKTLLNSLKYYKSFLGSR